MKVTCQYRWIQGGGISGTPFVINGVIKYRNMFFLLRCAFTFSGCRREMCCLSTPFSMSFLISLPRSTRRCLNTERRQSVDGMTVFFLCCEYHTQSETYYGTNIPSPISQLQIVEAKISSAQNMPYSLFLACGILSVM